LSHLWDTRREYKDILNKPLARRLWYAGPYSTVDLGGKAEHVGGRSQ